MKKRNFTKEFKLQVITELEAGKSKAEIYKEYEINGDLLSRWKIEYEKDPNYAFAGKGNIWKEDARFAKMERTIGRLYLENELLKKTHKDLQRLAAKNQNGRRE